jgi:hypothetical protein
MSDITNTPQVKIARYHADRDAHLRRLLGEVLQVLHDDRVPQTPFRLKLEIKVLGEILDCYENEGSFDLAEQVRQHRNCLVRQHLAMTREQVAA